MQIKFIGTGGAFDSEFGNSSAILTLNGENILIDCGHSVFPTLRRRNLIETIDAVLLTHLHDDHCGSLSTLIFYYNLISPKKKLRIYFPSDSCLKELECFLSHSHCKPEQTIEFVNLAENKNIIAIDTLGKHVEGMPTHAYAFMEGENIFVYSGDLGDCDFLFSKIESLGLKNPIVFHDIFFLDDIPGHTFYKNLVKYSDRIKIFGYHCDPRMAPADNSIPLVALHPEFLA